MVEIPSKSRDGIKNMLILRKYRALFLLVGIKHIII